MIELVKAQLKKSIPELTDEKTTELSAEIVREILTFQVEHREAVMVEPLREHNYIVRLFAPAVQIEENNDY